MTVGGGEAWWAPPCSSAYLADTLVVKETHSLTKVSGVVPVMSSHCAGVVPPERTRRWQTARLSSRLWAVFWLGSPVQSHPTPQNDTLRTKGKNYLLKNNTLKTNTTS